MPPHLLVQQLFFLKKLLFQSRSSTSELCQFLNSDRNLAAHARKIVEKLSLELKDLLNYKSRCEVNSRLTTHFAVFNDALDEFNNNNLVPMIDYLSQNDEVKAILSKHLPSLKQLCKVCYNINIILFDEPLGIHFTTKDASGEIQSLQAFDESIITELNSFVQKDDYSSEDDDELLEDFELVPAVLFSPENKPISPPLPTPTTSVIALK